MYHHRGKQKLEQWIQKINNDITVKISSILYFFYPWGIGLNAVNYEIQSKKLLTINF